jgi:hypothetical protein
LNEYAAGFEKFQMNGFISPPYPVQAWGTGGTGQYLIRTTGL